MVVLPEQDGNNEYSKVNLWADKAHLLPLKMELFDKAGKLLKVFEGKKVEQHEDSWILVYTKMTNVQKGSNTEIAVTDVNSGAVIPPSEFSPQALDK